MVSRGGLLGLGSGFAAAVGLAGGAWAARTAGRRSAARLTASIRRDLATTILHRRVLDPQKLAGLPAPVRRHLELVAPAGQPLPTTADAIHVGRISLGGEQPQWRTFEADQVTRLAPLGFDWAARVRMAPGVVVHVHDAYRHGHGLLDARLLGLFPVAHGVGPEIDHGELLRLLAEAPMLPTLMVESIEWEAVDDDSAWGTLRAGRTAARALFRFGDDGLISSIHAPERMMQQGKRFIPTPWEAVVSDYQKAYGLLIPAHVEVAWLPREGRRTYYEAAITVTSLE